MADYCAFNNFMRAYRNSHSEISIVGCDVFSHGCRLLYFCCFYIGEKMTKKQAWLVIALLLAINSSLQTVSSYAMGFMCIAVVSVVYAILEKN
jgi:hypothetical protein